MIWSPYGFFGPGGLTNRGSHGILRAKTAATPYISDTFSDTIGHTQYILNNFMHVHLLYLIILSLHATLTYIFYYI
jgi:hypothetical protein